METNKYCADSVVNSIISKFIIRSDVGIKKYGVTLDREDLEFYKQDCGFYLYPRSSISKTNLRLANSVGIIDSGYRGNILAIFDILQNDNVSTTIEKHSRLLQICSGDL
jgi:dUTPase